MTSQLAYKLSAKLRESQEEMAEALNISLEHLSKMERGSVLRWYLTVFKGDVFKIIVLLNDAYSYDFGINGQSAQVGSATQSTTQSTQTTTQSNERLKEESVQQSIIRILRQSPEATQSVIAEQLELNVYRLRFFFLCSIILLTPKRFFKRRRYHCFCQPFLKQDISVNNRHITNRIV